MTLFSRLGAFVRQLTGRGRIDKISILTLVDNNTTLLNSLRESLQNQTVLAAARQALHARATRPDRKDLQQAYASYRALLKGPAAQAERTAPFSALLRALELWVADHQDLRNNFTHFFASDGQASLTAEELRISQSVILGYLHLTQAAMEWAVYAIYLMGNSGRQPPLYMQRFLLEHAEDAAAAVTLVLQRSAGVTLRQELRLLHQHDVQLQTQGQTLDAYAQAGSYGPATHMALQGFMRSPVLMLGDAIANWQQKRYERNKAIRSWLAAKIAQLALEQQGVDPASPQYQELQKVINNYEQLITEYDEKIQRYER